MKTNTLKVAVMGIATLAAISSMAGGIGVQINIPAPVVSIQTPAVTVQAVPDSYVWDGTEYVGFVGSTDFYLGPGNVWLPLAGAPLARFHDWQGAHRGWRDHAIRNEKYRRDAKGHTVPLRDDHAIRDTHDVRDAHDGHLDDHDHGQPNHDFDHH